MAKNSISKISNAFSTGGGGGNFEQQIQAMFLLSLLIDGFCPAMNEQTKKVHFQAKHLGYDVDDLVVITYRNELEGKMLFPIFINYDKQDNISDTTKYEDHFVAENRLIAISKSGRSMDSEDVQNFLNATERGIDVQLFVRKNKDDKISKEFYYLGRVIATGNAKQFVMPNTDKTAVEIEWELETPVREDIYQYIVNE